eukprot:2385550-Pyramimonas_sp.AAC.1
MAISHSAGLKPALPYGSAVLGMSDCELKRARAALLSCRSPSHRDAAVAPAVQWDIAVWSAAVAAGRSIFTVADLARMYNAVVQQLPPTLSWGQSKGPISRM